MGEQSFTTLIGHGYIGICNYNRSHFYVMSCRAKVVNAASFEQEWEYVSQLLVNFMYRSPCHGYRCVGICCWWCPSGAINKVATKLVLEKQVREN